jgi:hypothetical protein
MLYPPKNHSHILIFLRGSEQEAFETEKELIRNWGRKDLGTGCLYNRTDGGENPPNWRGRKRGPQSKEHRRRLGESKKGRLVWNKGISPSTETRQKISKTLQGNLNALGHTVSDEARQKMSWGRKGKPSPRKGKKCSEETKRKMSEASRGRIPWNKNRIMSDAVRQNVRVAAQAREARKRGEA